MAKNRRGTVFKALPGSYRAKVEQLKCKPIRGEDALNLLGVNDFRKLLWIKFVIFDANTKRIKQNLEI